MTADQRLPDFIKPMLARPGEPFDSDDHLFEIKWDGIRACAYIENDGYRLMSRRQFNVTERYPEFDFLRKLPAGTILDGEIVVLDKEGKPKFRAVLTREQARSPQRYKALAKATPANFVVFDQMYAGYEPIMSLPLTQRRDQLAETTSELESDRFAISDGITGPGKAFFKQIVDRGLEGVVAKRLDARYQPGKRTDAWIKMRKSSMMLCAVIGYMPKEKDDFESLIIATSEEGELCCVGRVGTGFDTQLRDQLNEWLRDNECDKPLVRCDEKGRWVEPGLYCQIRYLERTDEGVLREPVFEQLITN